MKKYGVNQLQADMPQIVRALGRLQAKAITGVACCVSRKALYDIGAASNLPVIFSGCTADTVDVMLYFAPSSYLRLPKTLALNAHPSVSHKVTTINQVNVTTYWSD